MSPLSNPEHQDVLRNLAELESALVEALASESEPDALSRLNELLTEVRACRERELWH